MDRRDFVKYLSSSSIGVMALSSTALTSCITAKDKPKGISPSDLDELILIEGLSAEVLIKFGDKINSNEMFGDNNDYIALIPKDSNSAYMWVNHEYTHPLFSSGSLENTKENTIKQLKAVGGSLLELVKNENGWKVKMDSTINRRWDGMTMINFAAGIQILNQTQAMGTNSNCAGGVTPWGTFLTCEENYQTAWGERLQGEKQIDYSECEYKWHEHFNMPPEHYGWVVEINPQNDEAKKLVSLGRFAHESATVIRTKNQIPVVYSGDDKQNECLYKFISADKNSLEKGVLYAADLKNKRWLALDLEKSPELKKHFSTQLEVLIYARKAAKILGATPLDRPEDVEIDPITGNVFISLTNNKSVKNYHGQILKISESSDYDSLSFEWEYFITGGVDTGFSCPDNLCFDDNGNLWMASDISGSSIGKGEYAPFKNNGLFVIPRMGENAGKVIQIASAPREAEFTGLFFTPDKKQLLVSVQHPGEYTSDPNHLHSQWPQKGDIPRSSIVAISGPFLNEMVKVKRN